MTAVLSSVSIEMRKLLLVLLSAFALAACDSSSDSNNDPVPTLPPEWVLPAEGSSYRFHITTVDSSWSGNTLVGADKFSENDIFSIIASNVPFGTREHTFRYGWSNTFAQYHVTFEPNGDTGYGTAPETLEIFPTGALGRRTIPTSEATMGFERSVTTGYYENFGFEKLTLAGKTYDAVKVLKHLVTVVTPTNSTDVLRTVTSDQMIHFAPSLGFVVKSVKQTNDVTSSMRATQTRSQEMAEIL
jgi:hypothetical protein